MKAASLYTKENHSRNVSKVFEQYIKANPSKLSLRKLCKHYALVHSKTSTYTVYTKSGSNRYCSAYKDHIFYNKRYATNVYATNTCWRHPKNPKDHAANVMRQMFQKWRHTLIPKKCKPVRTGTVALTRIIFFTINVIRQMFMRQILAEAIWKFQKITW
jgi:hypothetical protein